MCNAGYIWNSITNNCDLCSTISGNAAPHTQGTCGCVTTRLWRGSTRSCIAPATAIDCTISPNAGINTPTPRSCNCDTGYTWSVYFRRCQLDCTDTTFNNNGAKPPSQKVCPCMAGSVWSSSFFLCQLDCLNIKYSGIPRIDDMTCQCTQGFVWNVGNLTCTVNCNSIPYASTWLSTSECTCSSVATWSQ